MQTVANVMHQVQPAYRFFYHFLRAHSQRSWLLATFLILHASPAIHPTLTAYPTVILHLPSDLALPFDVKSFPQKEWTLNLGKLIAREPFNLDLFASSLSLFPFVVYIIPHFSAMSIYFSRNSIWFCLFWIMKKKSGICFLFFCMIEYFKITVTLYDFLKDNLFI